jgi:hypothetical protein
MGDGPRRRPDRRRRVLLPQPRQRLRPVRRPLGACVRRADPVTGGSGVVRPQRQRPLDEQVPGRPC